MKYFKHKGLMIRLDDIRSIESVPSNPQGGPPMRDKGLLGWANGDVQEVSIDFTIALQKALKTSTVESS